jgi:hypothetical protein
VAPGCRDDRRLLARRDGLACGDEASSADSAEIRAASASTEALEVAGDVRRRPLVLLGGRGRVPRRDVDAVDLGQPVACGGLDVVAGPAGGARVAERELGRFLGGPDRAGVGRRGRGFGAAEEVVVGSLLRPQRLLGRGGGLPGTRRDSATLVGDPPQVGARVGAPPPPIRRRDDPAAPTPAPGSAAAAAASAGSSSPPDAAATATPALAPAAAPRRPVR